MGLSTCILSFAIGTDTAAKMYHLALLQQCRLYGLYDPVKVSEYANNHPRCGVDPGRRQYPPFSPYRLLRAL